LKPLHLGVAADKGARRSWRIREAVLHFER
jgi:hypothetical protein